MKRIKLFEEYHTTNWPNKEELTTDTEFDTILEQMWEYFKFNKVEDILEHGESEWFDLSNLRMKLNNNGVYLNIFDDNAGLIDELHRLNKLKWLGMQMDPVYYQDDEPDWGWNKKGLDRDITEPDQDQDFDGYKRIFVTFDQNLFNNQPERDKELIKAKFSLKEPSFKDMGFFNA